MGPVNNLSTSIISCLLAHYICTLLKHGEQDFGMQVLWSASQVSVD
jgi:hypothetical protein